MPALFVGGVLVLRSLRNKGVADLCGDVGQFIGCRCDCGETISDELVGSAHLIPDQLFMCLDRVLADILKPFFDRLLVANDEGGEVLRVFSTRSRAVPPFAGGKLAEEFSLSFSGFFVPGSPGAVLLFGLPRLLLRVGGVGGVPRPLLEEFEILFFRLEVGSQYLAVLD